MLQQMWTDANRKMTVCVDSYEDEVLKGRLYNAYYEMGEFGSLMQFLMGVQAILEEQQTPQSYTNLRRFTEVMSGGEGTAVPARIRKGTVATFEVKVLFRQHSSWQGVVIWRDRGSEQPFRSVLELALLMDSALRSGKEVVA